MKQTVKIQLPFVANLLMWFEVAKIVVKFVIFISALALAVGFVYLIFAPEKPQWVNEIINSMPEPQPLESPVGRPWGVPD